jgi:hypothetical protein
MMKIHQGETTMKFKFLLLVSLLISITFACFADETSTYLLPHDYINYEETVENVDNTITITYMFNKENNNLIVKTNIQHTEFNEGYIEVITNKKITNFMNTHGYYHYRNLSNSMIQYHTNEIIFTRFIYLYK